MPLIIIWQDIEILLPQFNLKAGMKFWLTLFFQLAILNIAKGQQQKEIMISGTVILNNKGIEGVLIKNESSNETTNSDTDGHFTIKCQLGDILHFSSISVETKRKKIIIIRIKLHLFFKFIDKIYLYVHLILIH